MLDTRKDKKLSLNIPKAGLFEKYFLLNSKVPYKNIHVDQNLKKHCSYAEKMVHVVVEWQS